MWISKSVAKEIAHERERAEEARLTNAKLQEELRIALRNNDQLTATLEWFKHRLNHVELERAQLVAAAINVKLQVPAFETRGENPTVADIMNQMPDLSHVGDDALEQPGEDAVTTGEDSSQYNLMAGHTSPLTGAPLPAVRIGRR